MSPITKEFTKEQLQQIIETDHVQCGEALALARIALASLEAEAVGEVVLGEYDDCGCHPDAKVVCIAADGQADWENFKDGTRLYTAQPAPVSVPAAMEMDDDFDSAFEHGKAVGWNAYRAAMLQAGTLTNEGTIPVTQFKPVADLYGLTSPTGSETSFTFDAVEARDFIDGGWSCQEYVELERFHEAITNHTEDKLAMVDHSGDSNNMVEPVTTACKLRYAVDAIRNSGIEIDAEKIFAERDALNTPDCWCRTCRPVTVADMRFVVCPECGNKRCPHANDHRNACTGSNEPGQEGSAYPAAPQQEVTQAVAKGMERYGDAMQKLEDSGD
ncbi:MULTISPECIES: hypothetical protein [unclassified Enterobacter]|uniref:hypothetical protein n=1 Tax=unclassified Enterobacter TaxID=2608935 RepID=UPI0038625617